MRNWQNNTLPTAGSIVSFPQTFSDFNLERCTSSTATDCLSGGSVAIRAQDGQQVARIELTKIVMPINGKMVFHSDTSIKFFEATNAQPKQWADRGEHQFDFNCAANWVVTGTGANPKFQIPCANDTVVFLDV